MTDKCPGCGQVACMTHEWTPEAIRECMQANLVQRGLMKSPKKPPVVKKKYQKPAKPNKRKRRQMRNLKIAPKETE